MQSPGRCKRLPWEGPSGISVVGFIPLPLWPDLVAFVGRRGGKRAGFCGLRGYSDMGERSQVEVFGARRLACR